MSDRLVRQIDPRPRDAMIVRRRMSEYADTANIVLLGDPGAGKSHLFEELAQAAKTSVQSAGNFLTTPPGPAGATLFIDGLDERRAGRSDRATIELIIHKLFAVRASRVRLACREHDWLGGTDIAAFHPYFAQSGGHVVLALEPLTELEQSDILKKNGVTDPQQFIEEATRRELSQFLTNPQNLKMLAEVVLKKAWPKSRRELFEETTLILLKEHNRDHRSAGGQYMVSEIRAPAGAACALRLISDVEGIGLAEAEIDTRYPSYRTIPFASPEITLASLGRRAFRGLGNEAVNYSHRVSAEYAAAGWLAQQVRDGLPLGRVQALIGIDGVPAPGLRGMHAWLALLLPDFSEPLIDADPFGILIYGDPNSFGLTHRVRLLQALSRLATADPYFRPEKDVPAALSALCCSDMAPHLKTVLQDTDAPFGIKQLVLEALASTPIPHLQRDIISIIADPHAPFGLKTPALRAATRLGSTAIKALVETYKSLGESADDIRLRAAIIDELYVGNFGPSDMSSLYNAAARCNDKFITGILWPLPTSIPTDDLPLVLDAIVAGYDAASKPARNRGELERFLDRLIVRALQECSDRPSGQRVWSWLELRSALRGDYNEREFQGIKPLLAERPELAHDIFNAAIDGYSPALALWRLGRRLQMFLPFPLSSEPLRWLADRLTVGFADAKKHESLLELAFAWVFASPDQNINVFESLYALADAGPGLRQVRDNLLANAIQSWQAEDKQRAAAELEERRAGRLKNLKQFAIDAGQIRDGTHLGWLTWAADVYFANFTDVDGNKSPRARLEEELGPENCVTALEGLKALARKGTLPSLQELAAADSKNAYPKRWYAFLAGMDELWLQTPSISGFSDEALKVLIGMDLLLPTHSVRSGESMEQDFHGWKDQIALKKPAIIKDTYLYLAVEALSTNKEHISGLYALLNEASLAPFRSEVVVHLLEAYPNLPPRNLEDLLQIALTEVRRGRLSDLLRQRFAHSKDLTNEQRQLWTIAAYLLSPDDYQASLEFLAKNAPSIVWRLRALTSYDRNGRKNSTIALKPSQFELFARIAASHFQNTGYPIGGWSGDENAWDAADYVQNLLSALSADQSTEATGSLMRLAGDPSMETYMGRIKHALANQRARRREMTYKQPTWSETIATLHGGAPANVSDLQALVVEDLSEISRRIGTQNFNIYKEFWNEDKHGRPLHPKVEESARDVLLGLLKNRLDPLGVLVEPEGQMLADKRADITVALVGRKSIIELKRDTHAELWSAPETQLSNFYARDADASGYGVYGIFWYGEHRQGNVPRHPKGRPAPRSASELEAMLNDLIGEKELSKLRAVVIDVSIPDGQRVGTRNPRPRKAAPAKAKTSRVKRRAKKPPSAVVKSRRQREI